MKQFLSILCTKRLKQFWNIDFSKDYNKVSYGLLLHELAGYGVSVTDIPSMV